MTNHKDPVESPPAYAPEYQDNDEPLLPINTQPTSQSSQNLLTAAKDNDWKKPLFGCFDNWALCLTTKFMPYLTFGEVSHKSGYGDCCSHGCGFCLGAMCLPCIPGTMVCFQRAHIRKIQGIDGNLCSDCLVGHFCMFCAMCQHSQEVGAHYERPNFNRNEMQRL